jgi:hypothetical protein
MSENFLVSETLMNRDPQLLILSNNVINSLAFTLLFVYV